MKLSEIIVSDRVRSEMGDIAELASSIKEHDLIQPIVLIESAEGPKLVAGGRRLAALQKLGVDELIHAKHFIWRSEIDDGSDQSKLRLQAVELEENLKRKEMTWTEVVLGKKRLLETMEKLHGTTGPGRPTRMESANGQTQGFGVRKLAAMLGESPANVSQDLRVAKAISIMPSLRTESSKTSAMHKANAVVIKALVTQGKVQAAPQRQLDYRLLVYCRDEKHQLELMEEFAQRGLKCQPVIV